MPTFEVDDKLHSHPKTDSAGLEAMGLWVVAGSWSADYLTDGFVPQGRALKFGEVSLWDRLVDAGFVERVDGGYQFHDWDHWNRTAVTIQTGRARAAEKKADQRARKRALSKCPQGTPARTSPGTSQGTPPGSLMGSPDVPRARVSQASSSSVSLPTEESTPAAPPTDKPTKSTQQSLTLPKLDRGFGFGLWQPRYKAKYGVTYRSPKQSPDGKIMSSLVDEAMSAARERAAETQTLFDTSTVADVLAHWFDSYLASDSQFLQTQRHPLRFLPSEIGKYGSPWETATSIDGDDFEWTDEGPTTPPEDPPGTEYVKPEEINAFVEQLAFGEPT